MTGSLPEMSRARRGEIVSAWAAQAFRAYSGQTARFLAEEPDPFRNPLGHLIQEALAELFDELVGRMNAEKVLSCLESIARVYAVQDTSPSEALGFLPSLKTIVRDALGDARENREGLRTLDGRIETVCTLASERLARCREHLNEIRIRERARRSWLQERMAARSR